MRDLLTALAMVLIIEGIPYFMFPRKLKDLVRILTEVDESYLRAGGFVLMLLGLFLLYLIKR